MSSRIKTVLRWLSLGAAAVMITVCEIPIITDSYEPNDTFVDAKTISVGSQVHATIEPSGDLDYYRFTVTGSGDVKLVYNLTVPSALRPEIFFYDSEQGELYRNHSSVAGDMLNDSLTVSPGDYFVRVSSFTSEESDTNYVLQITMGVPTLAEK